MKEPPRCKDINELEPYVRDRVARLIKAMEARGFDPIVFESRRSIERQKWLYGIGRVHQKNRRPVTWTMQSKHIVGKAVDIISKSHLWDYPDFYRALKQEAKKVGLKVLKVEQCHVEW
jgi:hypothetical protein